MAEKQKSATLSKGRASWCVIFRHPVCRAADGRNHLRVRRGLGASDKAEAQTLVEQMNEILGDPSYWKLGEREHAGQQFDPKIVAAFYDHMAPPDRDPWGDREAVIPLPGGKDATDGYARVQLIGTTGAGKTTLLRQLIGTDPLRERFPSISAAKTTVCDIEVVVDEGPFRAVVSFIDRDLVRQYIADCVSSAVIGILDNRSEREVVRRFLEHTEQRFRLSYLLGTPGKSVEDANLTDEDDEYDDDPFADEVETPSDEERQALQIALGEFLGAIAALGRTAQVGFERAAETLDIEIREASQSDRDAVQEIVEDELANHEDFHALVDKILEDIESRFEMLSDGEMQRGRDGWPRVWKLESDDRRSFVRSVNRFSSNYAPSFGRLLTPLVEGIRVAGEFCPTWCTEQPKLVLLDGQGLGHKADSASSISTSITRRYQVVDAILLVDNGAQPMQAAPCAALESIVASGHESKLIVCFTHFDEVRGDNLFDTQARKDHVLGSFDNAVSAIGKSHGRDAATALQRAVPGRIVFLSGIQKKLEKKSRLTRSELDRLLAAIAETIAPEGAVECVPVYDVANLVLSIQSATQEFHDRWRGILSMGSRSGVAPEHWTRVKALSRRLGVFRQDEYDTLRPVADLIRLVQNHLSRFLTTPLEWEPHAPNEEDESRTQAIDAIRSEVFTRLHELAQRRVLDERFSGWVDAYEHRGTGSTRVRARDIVNIYESAAPVPNEMPADANEFLFEIRELVADAVEAGGGKLRSWSRQSLPASQSQVQEERNLA